MINGINRKLVGWANFYKYTDFTAIVFGKADGIVFWKFAHWLASSAEVLKCTQKVNRIVCADVMRRSLNSIETHFKR